MKSTNTRVRCHPYQTTILGLSLVAILTLAGGCETAGLSPREIGRETYSDLIYSLDFEPESVQNTSVTPPISLMVAQIGETSPSAGLIEALASHQELFSHVMEAPLPGDPIRPALHRYNNPGNLKDRQDILRQQSQKLIALARQQGADYVFMVGGYVDSRVLSDPIEMLDFIIIPGFIVPSKTIKIEAKASGALIDATSGQVILMINAVTTAQDKAPTFYVDQQTDSLCLAQRDVLSENIAQKLINAITERL